MHTFFVYLFSVYFVLESMIFNNTIRFYSVVLWNMVRIYVAHSKGDLEDLKFYLTLQRRFYQKKEYERLWNWINRNCDETIANSKGRGLLHFSYFLMNLLHKYRVFWNAHASYNSSQFMIYDYPESSKKNMVAVECRL